MKKILFLLILFPVVCFSQKLKNKKFTIDFLGGLYSNFNKWEENGVSGGYEFSYNNNSIIYSTNCLVGVGFSKNINTKNGYIHAFLEANLLIGTKLKLSNSISLIPQTGIGYLHLTNHFQGDKTNLIGLPIQAKILFFDNKKLSVGLIPHVIFNKVQNNYMLNITLNLKI